MTVPSKGLSTRDALDIATSALDGAEDRPGQRAMAEAVAAAIGTDRHLIVQAGTGTGKTLGYLVPVVMSGRKTIISTATIALQDQLASKDLPLLVDYLAPALDIDFQWAVLKGRHNYICRQRLSESLGSPDDPTLPIGDEPPSARLRTQLAKVEEWADTFVEEGSWDVGRMPRSLQVSGGIELFRRTCAICGQRCRRGGGQHSSLRHRCRRQWWFSSRA